jgi:hypothetical protein
MQLNKKAELDEVILTIGVIIGIIIVAIWYIFFLSKQTVKTQNITFDSLNIFSSYYELILDAEEAEILSIELVAIDRSKLTIDGNQICIEAETLIKTCNIIISDSATYKGEYILDKINYFDFSKKEDGSISIKKQSY